jgi:hypothetical protein
MISSQYLYGLTYILVHHMIRPSRVDLVRAFTRLTYILVNHTIMPSRADLVKDFQQVGIVKVRLELTFIFMFWRRGHCFHMHSFSTVYF